MNDTPAERIKALKEEYQERSTEVQEVLGDVTSGGLPPTKPGVGHVWFDSSTNQLWVCTGRINGKLKWSKVPEKLYE